MPATVSARQVSPAPLAPTGAGRRALRAGFAGVALAAVLLVAGPAGAQVGGPVGPDDPTTTSKPERSTTTTDAPTTTDASEDPTPTSTAPATTEAPDDEDGPEVGDAALARTDDDDGTSAGALLLVGLGGLVLGLLLAGVPLALALSRRKGAAPVDRSPVPLGTPAPRSPLPPIGAAGPATATVAAGPAIGPAPGREDGEVRSQRARLIEGLVGLRDKLPSAALADEAGRVLSDAGVVELRPEGLPFDPSAHRAVDQVAVADAARHNVVIGVERPGYADGTHVIRQPEVVVARADGSS